MDDNALFLMARA